MFASGTFDVIYATYHVDVGETPFFVVVDYEKECVVVSIRGTLSLKVKKTIYTHLSSWLLLPLKVAIIMST